MENRKTPKIKMNTKPAIALGVPYSPFLDIDRDGYGLPWHEEYRGYKYAVKVHETRGYCYSVQKVSEDGAMIRTIEESYGHLSPHHADIAARLRIDFEIS
jgi:hypothetical protein